MSSSNRITVLHFNDVYNIESRTQEPVGGAARFATAVAQFSSFNPLVLFSGDAFNPSMMSTVTKGTHMVPVLNALNVQCAVYGNHDFDFGVDTLVKLAHETHFPWLMSNIYDMTTDEPLADAEVSRIITWEGKKIGIIGLVEEEWIATLATIDPDDVICLDFVEEGQRLARELRQEGVDCVIALTHMRWPNDIRLAENVPEIDLILGGHDHDFSVKEVNGRYIVKSGTDFRNLANITLTFHDTGKMSVNVEEVLITSCIEEDAEIKDIVSRYSDVISAKMEMVIGEIEVELDGRFSSIRCQETNLGNFVTDIMLEATDADIAVLNSGTLRSDMVHPVGVFRLKDLMSVLPMIDPIIVLKISGQQLLEALENSVSKYPALEGRFLQVAGIKFGFDPSKPPGQRVSAKHVKVQGSYIEMDKFYRLCTKSYLTEGKDGFDIFKQCQQLTNIDDGPALTTLVQNHFKSVEILRGHKRVRFQHRQSIIPVNRRKSLSHMLSLDDSMMRSMPFSPQFTSPARSGRASLCSPPRRSQLLFARRHSIESIEIEQTAAALAPKVEGRIFLVDDTNRHALDEAWMIARVQQTTIVEEEFESERESTTTAPASVVLRRNRPLTTNA